MKTTRSTVRARAAKRQIISTERASLTQKEKVARKMILDMAGSEIQNQISQYGVRYGIYKGIFLRYKSIHPWITERMLRHSVTKQNNKSNQVNSSTLSNTTDSCAGEPYLRTDHKNSTVVHDSVGVEVSIHFGHSTQNVSLPMLFLGDDTILESSPC